jgi:hypothetical protein
MRMEGTIIRVDTESTSRVNSDANGGLLGLLYRLWVMGLFLPRLFQHLPQIESIMPIMIMVFPCLPHQRL